MAIGVSYFNRENSKNLSPYRDMNLSQDARFKTVQESRHVHVLRD